MRTNWYDGDFEVAQNYGCTDVTFEPPNSNCASGHFHRGLDIMLPMGTPLFTPCDGITLQMIGQDPQGFGPNYPILLLPDGTQFLIGHTSSVVGNIRQLTQREVFAYSGNEGLSTGPHGHFQANTSPYDFINTKDPVPYLHIGGDLLTPDEIRDLKEVYVRLAYITIREDEPTGQELAGWLARAHSNTNEMKVDLVSILDSTEAVAFRAKLQALFNAGPSGGTNFASVTHVHDVGGPRG